MKLKDKDGNEYNFTANYKDGALGSLNEIKPEPKKIDMSVCIESGIDCEFSSILEFNKPTISKVTSVLSHFSDNNNDMWKHCRPRLNHIHASPAGWDKCPIPKGFIIRTWQYDLHKCFKYEGCNYLNTNWSVVTMFEITGIQEGYEL